MILPYLSNFQNDLNVPMTFRQIDHRDTAVQVIAPTPALGAIHKTPSVTWPTKGDETNHSGRTMGDHGNSWWGFVLRDMSDIYIYLYIYIYTYHHIYNYITNNKGWKLGIMGLVAMTRSFQVIPPWNEIECIAFYSMAWLKISSSRNKLVAWRCYHVEWVVFNNRWRGIYLQMRGWSL